MNLAPLLHQYGYAAIFLVLFLEAVGIPAPSEITLVTAGVMAAQGQLSAPLAIVVAACGSTGGACVSYLIGRTGGRKLILLYGRRVGITEERMTRVEKLFTRWGMGAVIVGRILSGVRLLISYPAGFFEMPFSRFLVATVIGALAWPILAVEAGRVLGHYWDQVVDVLIGTGPWILAGLAVAGLGYLIWRLRQRHRTPL